MLDQFQSMDEIKAYIKQLKPYTTDEEYELILYYFGLLENQGISEQIELNGQQVKIDKYLTPMIKELNQNGIKTLACCSGLQEEHLEAKYKPAKGYLCIEYNEEHLAQLNTSLNDEAIQIQKSTCYLQPCIGIQLNITNDTELKEKWQLVWNALKELYK